ncbi:DUF2341 domain-containing protein [Geobacter sp. DSM 9736]|uniref:DUF2341 domain-containing protein n=1 Tax=Geobacter sp. DSM 9736 TaxID=1277350 RepID=UPI000B50B977|nr:DUF2341 domain-containing protein [Geobacter sp. DSM 9736]SNB47458.1 delta-60 repeat domain-containing protein [Geobacter sp. DSM 9736]
MIRTNRWMTIFGGKMMNYQMPAFEKRQAHLRCKRLGRVLSYLLTLALVVPMLSYPSLSLAKGGDVHWQLRDTVRGKQEIVASTADSDSNVIAVGFTNFRNAASTDEDYWVVKLRSDGSGMAWNASYDRRGGADRAVAVAVDANNDVIVSGYAWNGTDNDIHTIKYSGATGTVLWQNTYSGVANDIATSVSIDRVNNMVYVGGYAQNASGNDDYLILKYDNAVAGAENAPQQVISYGGANGGPDRLMSLSAGVNGFAVTGQTWNSSSSQFDCLTQKYDFSGNKVREWRYQSGKGVVGNFVQVDAQGNVIVSGTVEGELDRDVYTAKYTASTGMTTWQHTYNGVFDDVPTGMYVDVAGDVYITGYTWTAEGNNDILTMRYNGTTVNPAGDLIWTKSFNSAIDNSDIAAPTGIVVDEALYGDVYVTGYTIANGFSDFQTIKYKKENGNILWFRSFNGAENRNDRPVGISLSAQQGVSVIGWSDNTKVLAEGEDSNPMFPLDGGEATATGGSATSVVNSGKSWSANQWTGYTVRITAGANSGAAGYIIANSGTTLTVAQPFSHPVTAGDTYVIVGSKSSITDGTKSWAVDQWAGYHVRMTSGANNGAVRRVVGNTASTLTVDVEFGSAVAVGDSYVIFDKEDYDTYLIKYDRGRINRPTNLVAETMVKDGTGHYAIRLSWVDNSANEEGFRIERRLGENGAWVPVTTVSPGTTEFLDTGLDEGNYYYYRVWAYNAATIDDPDYSNEAHALAVIVYFDTPTWSHTYNSEFNLEDYATAIAIGPDDHPVVTGKSDSDLIGMYDYLTRKLNRADSTLMWSSRYDSMQNEMDIATCIAIDGSNNAYVSGYSSLYYDPVGQNVNSVFTMKYPSSGPPSQWGAQYNGPGGIDDRSTAVTSTTDGSSIVVTGYGKNPGLNEDIYLVKYGPNPSLDQYGNALPVWSAVPFDGGGDDFPTAVAIAPDGNIFVSGYRQNGTSYDLFLAKYEGVTGALIWTDTYDGGSNGEDRGLALALDAAGDPYVAGFVTNTQGNRDFVLIRYIGSSGTAIRQWVRTFDGPSHGNDWAAAVEIDPVDGFAVVAGTTSTGPDDRDFCLIRYAATGAELWQRTLQRPLTDEVVAGMRVDNSGNIYITGDTGDGVTTDSLTVKYNHEGAVIDAALYQGTAGGFDQSAALAVNSLGEAFIAGYTTNASGNADYLVYRMSAEQLPAPYPFTQTPLYTTLALAWTDKSSVEDGYVIKRRSGICIDDDSDSSWVTVASPGPNVTTYTDTNLSPGTTYCYRINSYRGSVPSRMVKREVMTLMPPAPGDFSATPVNTTRIDLAWTDTTSGENQFRIERCTGASCTDFVLLGTAQANATSYEDMTVCSATPYRYRLTAIGPNWVSEQAMASGVTQAPRAPEGLAALRVSEAEVRLQWSDVSSDEGGFRIERCVGEGCSDFVPVGTATENATSYNDSAGLGAGATYRYRVKAVKSAICSWESPPSGIAEATTAVTAPGGLAGAAVSTTRVDLAWTDTTASETGFVIERCTGAGCTFETLDAGFPVTVNYNTDHWSDHGACSSATYTYRIRAVDRALPMDGGGAWSKRAPVAISNFQPYFQTRVVVPFNAGMKTDFGDIRFFDARDNTQLPYWLESKVDGVSATFWIKTRGTNSVYLYYGNPLATSAARGSDTFEFFEDFSGTVINSGKWNIVNPTYFRQDGELIATGGTGNWDSGLYSTFSFARPFTFEVDQYVTGGNDMMLGAKDSGSGIHFGDFVHAGYLTGSSNNMYVYEDGNNRGYRSLSIPLNTWRTFRFDVLSTGAGYWQGPSLGSMSRYYDSTYSNESPLRIGFVTAAQAFKWDNARVRRYATPAPASSIGAQEAAPALSGSWDSDYSNTSVVTLPTPGAPTDLSAIRVSEIEVKLQWTRNSTDDSGFHIDRCTGEGCDFSTKVTFTAAAGSTEYRDVDVVFGTAYTYRVSAFKSAACGWETSPSAAASATTSLLPPAAAAAEASIGNDCNDLRFMDDNATSLEYHIESGCNTAATRVWLRVPSVPSGSKQIFLYTANPPASAVSNPAAVFDFYEDFSGSALDGGKWVELDTAANYLTVNGGLKASGGAGSWGSVGLYSVPSFPRPFVLEAAHYRSGGSYMMLGLKDTSTYSSLSYYPYMSYPVYDGNGNRLQVYESGTSRGDNLRGIQSGTWQYYKIDVLPNSGAKYYHGSALQSLTPFYEGTHSTASPLKVGILNNNQAFSMNMVRVRKYANPEPVATPEQEGYGSYLLSEGSWFARRPITISNAGPAQTDYQVAVILDTTSSAADRIALSWSDTTGSETGFAIERCAGAACGFESPSRFMAAANATSYVDWAVANAGAYCYRVRAVREGVWEAPWSEIVCAATSTATAPANLTASASETKVDLAWSDTTTGENGFRIERCTGVSCDFTTIDPGFPVTVGMNSTSYTDTAVCSNAYRYRVEPFKAGPGGWSAPLYSNIADAVTRLPSAPTALAATRASETEVNLVWSDTTGDESGFRIERCEGSTCDSFTEIGTVTANVTSFSSIGLKPGTSYRFRVRAFKTAACGWDSPYSEIAVAITDVVPPSGLTGTAPNTTQLNLSWIDNTVSETAFLVNRCSQTNCDFSVSDSGFPIPLPANSTTWSDSSVCESSAYRYRIGVLNKGLSLDGSGTWTKRKPLNFTNFKAGFLARVTIPYASGMKNDFSDIRFYDEGAYKELPHWIESRTDGVSATVWLKTGPTSQAYLYYGNAAAQSASSAAGTFGNGLMGFWPINEVNGTVTGTTADLSGQGNDLALNGFIGPYGIISGGRYGNAMSLDGINDFMKKDAVSLPTGSTATIEAWIYPKSYAEAAYNGIVSFGNRSSRDSLLLSIQNTGRPSMATWGNDFVPSSGPIATLNAWNHIAVTVNGTAVTLYMNGQAVSGVLTYQPSFQSKNLSIGSTDYTPGRLFNGYIDEVRIYNRALTAAEIASRYATVPPVVQLGVEETDPGYVFAAAYDHVYSLPASATMPAKRTPGGLNATRASEVQINLSWSDSNNDETGFKIERCEGSGCTDFIQIDTVAANTLNYSDTNRDANLKPNTIYRYRVRAYKTASCPWDSNYSAIAQAETTVLGPASLAASAVNTTQINLTWSDRTVSESGFLIERCTGSACDFSTKNTFPVGPNITSWSDTTVCNSGIYRYQVKAVKRGLSLDGDGTWTRRAPLSISDFRAGFQVRITVPYDPDMRNDFADIRFFDATANLELPYWVEAKTDGVSAEVWIKTGKNNNIWLYYGNQQAASAANGATVFDFFDDFAGTAIDTSKWNIVDGTGFSVSGGFLHGTSTTGRITSRTSFSSGIVQEVKAKATSLAPNGQVMAGFYNSYYNNLGFLDHPGSAHYSNNGSWTAYGIEIPASMMLYSLTVRDSSTVSLKIHNLDVPTPFWNVGDVGNTVSGEVIALGRRYDSDGYNGQTYTADWDWVRVRKYASVEPAVLLGAEEESTGFVFTVLWTSPYSIIASATAPTPAIPGNFSVAAVTDTQINVTWTETIQDEDGFKLEQCSSNGCTSDADFTQIVQAGPSVVRHEVGGLNPSSTYCFRLRATKAASCGWDTAYTPIVCDTTFSAHPINLNASAEGSFKVLLTWNDVSTDEDGFEIQAKVWNGEWVRVAAVPSNSTSYTVRFGIEPKMNYTYRVRAIRGEDNSPFSNEASATTPPYAGNHGTCQ